MVRDAAAQSVQEDIEWIRTRAKYGAREMRRAHMDDTIEALGYKAEVPSREHAHRLAYP